MTVPRFYFGMHDDPKFYAAVGYGRRWNGWANPIVTRETLIELVSDWSTADDEMTHTLRFDGAGVATLEHRHRVDHDKYAEPGASYDETLTPDADGNYAAGLGLTLNMEGDD